MLKFYSLIGYAICFRPIVYWCHPFLMRISNSCAMTLNCKKLGRGTRRLESSYIMIIIKANVLFILWVLVIKNGAIEPGTNALCNGSLVDAIAPWVQTMLNYHQCDNTTVSFLSFLNSCVSLIYSFISVFTCMNADCSILSDNGSEKRNGMYYNTWWKRRRHLWSVLPGATRLCKAEKTPFNGALLQAVLIYVANPRHACVKSYYPKCHRLHKTCLSILYSWKAVPQLPGSTEMQIRWAQWVSNILVYGVRMLHYLGFLYEYNGPKLWTLEYIFTYILWWQNSIYCDMLLPEARCSQSMFVTYNKCCFFLHHGFTQHFV